MVYTLHTKLLGAIAAVLLTFAIAPFAFAEEDATVDWEAKANEKVALVEDLLEEAEELADDDEAAETEIDDFETVLEAIEEMIDEADFEAAYDAAADLYGEVSELIAELEVDTANTEDGESDEATEEDEDTDDKKRPAACDKEVRGNAYGLRALCADKAEKVSDRVKAHREKCNAEALEDGEEDKKFCRNGEWKEKREAKLDDIMSGFVEAADLTDEQSEQIREEVQALVRQLIALILANRLGS